MTGTPLSINGLSVRYPDQELNALSDLSFGISQGTRVCVLGENGSGKTTLAHASLGIVPLLVPAMTTGSVSLLGRPRSDAKSIHEFARGAAILFQNPEFQFLGLSVRDELAASSERTVSPDSESVPHVSEFLDRYGMAHLLFRDSQRMSMGEMQRIAILSAIISQPQLVLFDEPTSALDEDGLDLVRAVLADSPQAAAVIFTHDGDWGRTATQHVIGLHKGEKVLDCSWEHAQQSAAQEVLQAHDSLDLLPGCEQVIRILESERPAGPRIDRLTLRGVASSHPLSDTLSIRNIDLQASEGQVICLVGPNGAGKTTILLTAAELLKPKRGRVTFLSRGKPTPPRSGKRPRVAMMLQNPTLQLLAESIREELCLSLRLLLRNHRRIEEVVQAVQETFGLSSLHLEPESLSFGWQKMLSLACCLCLDPDVYVLDEPELGLDTANREATAKLICYLAHSLGRIVLISSHDREFARLVADKVLTVQCGAIVD